MPIYITYYLLLVSGELAKDYCYVVVKFHGHSYNTFGDMNYYPVNYYPVNFGNVTDRQTESDTYENCTKGRFA